METAGIVFLELGFPSEAKPTVSITGGKISAIIFISIRDNRFLNISSSCSKDSVLCYYETEILTSICSKR